MGNRLSWVIALKSLGRFDRAGSNPALGTKHKGVIPNRITPFPLPCYLSLSQYSNPIPRLRVNSVDFNG
jgi:hypothetical protein